LLITTANVYADHSNSDSSVFPSGGSNAYHGLNGSHRIALVLWQGCT